MVGRLRSSSFFSRFCSSRSCEPKTYFLHFVDIACLWSTVEVGAQLAKFPTYKIHIISRIILSKLCRVRFGWNLAKIERKVGFTNSISQNLAFRAFEFLEI
jgi:hypothetical protein